MAIISRFLLHLHNTPLIFTTKSIPRTYIIDKQGRIVMISTERLIGTLVAYENNWINYLQRLKKGF